LEPLGHSDTLQKSKIEKSGCSLLEPPVMKPSLYFVIFMEFDFFEGFKQYLLEFPASKSKKFGGGSTSEHPWKLILHEK